MSWHLYPLSLNKCHSTILANLCQSIRFKTLNGRKLNRELGPHDSETTLSFLKRQRKVAVKKRCQEQPRDLATIRWTQVVHTLWNWTGCSFVQAALAGVPIIPWYPDGTIGPSLIILAMQAAQPRKFLPGSSGADTGMLWHAMECWYRNN